MIKSLRIKNIGGISEAELSFTEGLNVITGESGTGKTSIVRALELLTGNRGSSKYIRTGEDKGTAEIEFTDAAIKREQSMNGRTKAEINGKKAKVSDAAEAVKKRIKIQSQFSQIELLKHDNQLAMLDSCLPEKIKTKIIKEYRDIYETAKQSMKELEDIKERRTNIEAKHENADEIFNLVKKVKPESNLEMKLENELSEILHRISVRERAEESCNVLTGGLAGEGLLREGLRHFEELHEFLNDEEINVINSSFDNLYNILNSIDMNDGKSDENEKEKIKNRLSSLRRLKRLCRIYDENELLEYCNEIYKDLEWFSNSLKDLKEITERYSQEKDKAEELAKEIHSSREQTAEDLKKRVNKILKELNMPDTEFNIEFKPIEKLNINGSDDIEFIFKEGLRSGRIDEIASGGELSRLLLALQISLPDEWLPETMVFDEIEAGLGGKAAVLSGMQLKNLSQRCQVILITHEASIAALGKTHIMIERKNGDISMKNIDGTARIKEIARMLSGMPDMAEAQEHAKKLLPI